MLGNFPPSFSIGFPGDRPLPGGKRVLHQRGDGAVPQDQEEEEAEEEGEGKGGRPPAPGERDNNEHKGPWLQKVRDYLIRLLSLVGTLKLATVRIYAQFYDAKSC